MKAQIKKAQSKSKPVINHHRASDAKYLLEAKIGQKRDPQRNTGYQKSLYQTGEEILLKPLPKIDPKDKRKKKIEEEDESESESDSIPEAEKKILRKRLTNEALIRNFDDIKARIKADRLLAEKLQEQEREQFTIEERAKFLHDTIVAQRKFLAQQRSEAIRNRPPTKNQLRNQMRPNLKPCRKLKHSELKIKKFEEIQVLYEKIKSEVIKEESKEEVQEESKEEAKEENKGEESTRKRKLGTRKKMKSRKRRFIQNTSEDDSEKENDELRLHLTIAPDEEKEVDYEILDRKYPIKEWKTECLGTKPQADKAEHLEEINQNVVIRSNGQNRNFSTLMRVLSILDREDLNAVYQLVMDRYQDEIPEGFDRKYFGEILMVISQPNDKNEFWNSQTAEEKEKEKQGPPCLWPYQKIILLSSKENNAKEINQLKDSLYPTQKGPSKAMTRFQSLLRSVRVHGAGVSLRMQSKFLRSLLLLGLGGGILLESVESRENQDNRRRDAWNSGTKDGSRTGQKEDSKALVTIDGEVSEPVVNESNIECQPKVWSDAPIIEEYESDSEDDLNHLIRDCDFHGKRMARKAELNNGWNNVQRVNKQNQFVPSAVLTRTGKIPVSTARTSKFKNKDVIEFCGSKGIKREYSNARTPQQNGVARG
ncbi:hypothetical protein Tco_0413233 [Tanacetum coccineum]